MITIEKLFPDTQVPARHSMEAAGYDVYAYTRGRELTLYTSLNERVIQPPSPTTVLVPPHHRILVPLGFKARLPYGFEAQVRSRSGLVLKEGLCVANQPGTIDSDYAEEWGVILLNTSDRFVDIEHGMRVAQIVLNSVTYFAWVSGTVTGERSGFGSTGV